MPTFKPYAIYASRLPVLKPGHFIKVADKIYQIVVVRHNRQTVEEADLTGKITEKALNSTTDNKFQALHGNLEVGRITHMQYLACSKATATILYWGKEPLGSKWVKIVYNSDVAEVAGPPVEVDRRSYNKELRLAVTIEGIGETQKLYIEMVEYEVKATALKPKRYLKILPNGQAVFIEAP